MGILERFNTRTMNTFAALATFVGSAAAFQAPASLMAKSASQVYMFAEGDIGVTPPLGVFDPLGLIETRDMRRYEIMEIKHGRSAMLGFLGLVATEAGLRFTGSLSPWAGIPAGGWLQIMVTTCMMETGYFLFNAQTDDAAAGDIGPDWWVRYDDEETKTFKLNAERNNGRAAMLGSFGVILHELLGVDGLYPTGGMGGAAPPTIF